MHYSSTIAFSPEIGTGTHSVMEGFVLEADPDPDFDVEAVTSQVLDNVLTDLEELRSSLERTGRKVVDDVRDAANSMGTSHLRGVETEVTYDDVVKLVNHLKRGIARRRVVLEDATG